MKILSVDDKPENLYLIESMLQGANSGYEVVSAHNGAEALQLLEHDHFDLIISDILMPQMDGFELCHQVKQHPKLRAIPFVFYTATYTESKDKELGLRLGASRFIIKPVEPEEFLRIICAVIADHEAGKLTPAPVPTEKEEVLLRSYNKRLVHKLDSKLEQLEEVNRKLRATLDEKDREVQQRRKAEEEVRQLNSQLEERVRQRTAELLDANEDLEAFVAAASHDLRAPLRALIGYSQILTSTSLERLDPQGRNCLERLHAEAQRMNRLIEGLLQLSRARRAEVRREDVNLSQMARDIERDLLRDYRSHIVDFRLMLGLTAQGDPTLLRSALRNLLSNAWKFTSKTPNPQVEFGQKEMDGRKVFFVKDNGAGFRMEDANKLFVPFERLHDSEEYPGNGVGLATVQQIVQRHGGEIWSEGAEGKGATFYFTLPQ